VTAHALPLREPLFAAATPGVEVSFEVFPVAQDAVAPDPWIAIDRLAPLAPRFVSVTCGAGGGTRGLTRALAERIQADSAVPGAAHIVCAGASREDIDDLAAHYWAAGIRHIVALRGDPPQHEGPFRPHPLGYRNAAELVAGLKRVAPFEISVAAYPECHPDSPNRAADLDNLWRKVDAGADRAITQFFFSADCFLRFRDQAAALGIDTEIVPGILPVASVAGVRRFADRCGASIPAWIDRLFEGLDDLPGERALVAATVAADLCAHLYAAGTRHFHFFTLNRAELSYAICHLLGLRPKEHCHERSRAA